MFLHLLSDNFMVASMLRLMRWLSNLINSVPWCNGSTTVFGSVSGGSNPPRTTNCRLEVHLV